MPQALPSHVAPQSAPRVLAPERDRAGVGLWIILLVAAGLRAAGLLWGLPTEEYPFALHPDESNIVLPAFRMWESGSLNPENFPYGSLFYYLVWACGAPLSALGVEFSDRGLILLGRWIVIVFGVAAVYVVQRLGQTLWDRRTGLSAAWFMAIAPALTLHGGFATVDAPATFFTTCTLWFAVRYGQAPSVQKLAWAGLFAGLAAATKYPTGLVGLAPLTALWMRASVRGVTRLRASAQLAGAALVGFLIGCPYALLDFASFWDGASFELLKHSMHKHAAVFDHTGNGWVYLATTNLVYALGPVLWLLSLVGLWSWKRAKRPGAIIVWAFGIPFLFMLGWVEIRFMRYTLPVLPLFVLGAGHWVSRGFERAPGWRKAAWVGLLLPLIPTALQVRALWSPPSQLWAVEYIQTHAGPTDTLAQPYWPLFSEASLVKPLDPAADSKTNLHSRSLILGGLKGPLLQESKSDWFLISEVWWGARSLLPTPETQAFFDSLSPNYRLEAAYSPFPEEWRWVLGFTEAPPDWVYPFLEQRIYRRVTERP